VSPPRWRMCLSTCAPRCKLKIIFAASMRRDVAALPVRLGSLYGPEAASATCTDRYNAHLHTQDVGGALLAALLCPGGIYNVCDDTDPVSHDRFTEATGWRPRLTR
jgi:hypothetical protein